MSDGSHTPLSHASERELDGLVPRHRSSFVEGSAGSRLAEPGTGCAEVALAPGLEEREEGEGSAELLPFRVDGSLEAEGVFVSSEAGGGQGETEDLDGLLHHVFACERGFEGAQPVLLGEGVVPPVHGAVGEVVIRRAHVHDVFAVAHRGMELQCQRFRALELPGYDEHLANAGERAADECVVTETARELEVLLEQLERPRLLSPPCVQSPAQLVAGCRQLRLVPDGVPELDRLLESTQRGREPPSRRVDRPKVGQRPGRERSVLHG